MDHELTVGEVPADMLDQVKKYRSPLIENAVAEDVAMLEKYFEVGEGPSTEEIKQSDSHRSLGRQVLRCYRRRRPRRNCRKVLDMVNDYPSAPNDRSAVWGRNPKTGEEIERKHDASVPLSGLAFKITTDPFVGAAGLLPRLPPEPKVAPVPTAPPEKRARRPYCGMQADKREDITEVPAGDIAPLLA